MIILIHDIELPKKAADYFKKFKGLELISKNETDVKLKDFWKDTKTIIDTTSNHDFYKKCKGDKEEKIFSKNVDFVEFKGRKVVNLFTLKNYFYKKANFSETQYETILKKRKIIDSTLSNICTVFQNPLERELENLKKTINIKEITIKKEDMYFVKNINEDETAGENVLDVNDFMVLKELKDILLYQI